MRFSTRSVRGHHDPELRQSAGRGGRRRHRLGITVGAALMAATVAAPALLAPVPAEASGGDVFDVSEAELWDGITEAGGWEPNSRRCVAVAEEEPSEPAVALATDPGGAVVEGRDDPEALSGKGRSVSFQADGKTGGGLSEGSGAERPELDLRTLPPCPPADPEPDPDDFPVQPRGPQLLEDAIGIRIDESGLGDTLIPQLNTRFDQQITASTRQRAWDDAPIKNKDRLRQLTVNLDTATTVDFLAPTAGLPRGGVDLRIDVTDMELAYRIDPTIGEECHIWIRPDDGFMTARLGFRNDELDPVFLLSAEADFDDSFSDDISTSGICWWYLIDDAIGGFFTQVWNGIRGLFGWEPDDPDAPITEEFSEQIISILGQVPTSFMKLQETLMNGIELGRIEGDDHGVKITFDGRMDANPDLHFEHAVDPGNASDIWTLLGERTTTSGDEVEASALVDPYVFNAMLAHWTWAKTFNMEFAVDGALAESLVSDPGAYPDDKWTVVLQVFDEERPPYLEATPHQAAAGCATGGACFERQSILNVPYGTLELRNDSVPVARTRGSWEGIEFGIAPRGDAWRWGPVLDLSTAVVDGELIWTNGSVPSGTDVTPLFQDTAGKVTSFMNGIQIGYPAFFGTTLWIGGVTGSLAGDDNITLRADLIPAVQATATLGGDAWNTGSPNIPPGGKWVTVEGHFHLNTNLQSPQTTWTPANGETIVDQSATQVTLSTDVWVDCDWVQPGDAVTIGVTAAVEGTLPTPMGPMPESITTSGTAEFDLGYMCSNEIP